MVAISALILCAALLYVDRRLRLRAAEPAPSIGTGAAVGIYLLVVLAAVVAATRTAPEYVWPGSVGLLMAIPGTFVVATVAVLLVAIVAADRSAVEAWRGRVDRAYAWLLWSLAAFGVPALYGVVFVNGTGFVFGC